MKNFDASRISEEKLLEYATFLFRDNDHEQSKLLISKVELTGKTKNEALEHARRIYDVFRRAERYALTQKREFTDEEAMKEAYETYADVIFFVVANCTRVYFERINEDDDQARIERAYLYNLNKHIDVDEHIPDALEENAEILCKRWLETYGPEHARKIVQTAHFLVFRNLAAAAIFEADSSMPENATSEEWMATFHTIFGRLVQTEGENFFRDYALQEAEQILEEELKPVEMPLQSLRLWAGLEVLEARVDPKKLYPPANVEEPALELRARDTGRLWALTMMPAQSIDRAARGASSWDFPKDDVPVFRDANNKHSVSYVADGLTQEELREGVMRLNPRTADVWRLVTATILENWHRGEKEPPRVWLDARQLCDAMGFKKHQKGGHRPENVALAARALVDLERFLITIPLGAKQYPEGKNGKRKQTTVQARRQHKVLAVLATEDTKQLFDAEWMPLRWRITAGDWIKDYPRNQFAPLFRSLVELPSTYTSDVWAKSIGTELVWQYRQDAGKVQTQKVETMLKQACILDRARQDHRKGRIRDNFEKAMDSLQANGVCVSWTYNGGDIDRVEMAANAKGWFELWIRARIIVEPPPEIVEALQAVAKAKRRSRPKPKQG